MISVDAGEVFTIESDTGQWLAAARLLGFLNERPDGWFRGGDTGDVQARIDERADAKARRDFAEADRIRAELADEGVLLEDGPGGTTWRRA